LIALLAALALAALIGARPWQATPVGPRVGLAPGLGVGLDGAVRVGGGPELAVARARPALGGGPTLAADRSGGHVAPSAPVGLESARVVVGGATAAPQPVAVTEPPPAVEPPPAPVAAPEPVATPVAAPEPQPAAPSPTRVASGPHPSGPSTAGLGDLGEEDEEEAPEEEVGGDEDAEVECSPPFPVFYEGAWRELVLCWEEGTDGGFYLLLDGEPLQDLDD